MCVFCGGDSICQTFEEMYQLYSIIIFNMVANYNIVTRTDTKRVATIFSVFCLIYEGRNKIHRTLLISDSAINAIYLVQ